MNHNNRLYFALLHNIGVGHKKLYEMYHDEKNSETIYTSLSSEFLEKYGYKKHQTNNILEKGQKIQLSDIEKYLVKFEADIVLHTDVNYPDNLHHISHPPFLMYVQGAIDNGPKFSIVGSRKITSYGEKCIDHIVPAVGKYFEIVSGGALGCDTAAHRVALNNNIKTIVVVGTGLAECYPAGNKELYKNISAQGGAIISIFPFTEPGSKYNFPIRNEIVAGLSVGTLVVEAQEKSGTLITANLCHDLGKDVFACPGEIFKQNSSGCNTLIKSGSAKIVCHPDDILQEYNISHTTQVDTTKNHGKKFQSSDILEKKIYELLLREAMSIDELFEKIDTDISSLTLKLSLLEIGGYIQKGHAGKYELK